MADTASNDESSPPPFLADELEFRHVVPILSVKNVEASIEYYVHKLGFTKKWDWPDGSNVKGFAGIGRGQVEIFLCCQAQGKPGTWLSIFVRDVDALYEQYKARGVKIRQPPTNFPWGIREMNVEDLDGHRLRIGSDATGPPDGTPLAEQD